MSFKSEEKKKQVYLTSVGRTSSLFVASSLSFH